MMENTGLIAGVVIVAMVAIGWGVIEMVGRGLDSERSTRAPKSKKRMAAKRRPKSSRSRRR